MFGRKWLWLFLMIPFLAPAGKAQTRYVKGKLHPLMNFMTPGPYIKGKWNRELIYIMRCDDKCLGKDDCARTWTDADIRLEPLSKGEITRQRNTDLVFSFRTDEPFFEFAVWADAVEGLFLVDTIRVKVLDSADAGLAEGSPEKMLWDRLNPQEFDPADSFEEWFQPENRPWKPDPDSRYTTGFGMGDQVFIRGEEMPILVAMRDELTGYVFFDSLALGCSDCTLRRGTEKGIWWVKAGESDKIFLDFFRMENGKKYPFERKRYYVEDRNPKKFNTTYLRTLWYKW